MNDLFKKIYSKSSDEFYSILNRNLLENKKSFIVTANPETFMLSENDVELKQLLFDEQTIVVPDGIGVVKAAKFLKINIKERIAGIDIANQLLEYGNEQKKTIYFFGAKQEVIDDLINVVKDKYPNLKIVGSSNGYVKDKDKVFDEILKLAPDIVLVALGIPYQEKIIYKHLKKFKKGIFVGVGGSFDVISGHKNRAPKFFIKTNTEWLYRIIKEPKRIKRFYNSNIKFLFKLKKKQKKTNDILFLIVICLYLLACLIRTIAFTKDVNYYENRMSYKIPKISLNAFINKQYQDGVESAFSDQILLSTTMKKSYNYVQNYSSYILMNLLFENNCNNRYITLNSSTIIYGCENNIVYQPKYIGYSKEDYDDRINNINDVIKSSNADLYIYYIEKDTDIDFSNNEKTDIYEYLKSNINTSNISRFKINNFDEFNEYFYKTDHHWNYKGSYKAYKDLIKVLTDDSAKEYKNEICLENFFSGSKANFSGASNLFKEKFCAYVFDYGDMDIYINGKKSDYGKQDYYLSNLNSNVSYANYYGFDDGEVIFDTHNLNKKNILIVGESYDNAILKLLATHFNKTFSIDLRNYERENNKEFLYNDYLKNNNIDVVLLIGNIDYFKLADFNLEV